MVLGNFVDGDVPDWDTGDDDPLGVDVAAIVVFHPDIRPKAFELSCLALEQRRETRRDLMVHLARGSNPRFRLIDEETIHTAQEACSRIHGFDYLDTFLTDTLGVAIDEIGSVANRARTEGVRVTPERHALGISVRPARSFADRASMAKWEEGKRARWKPSVRLEVSLALDGPFTKVERFCEEIRRAVSTCGPLTFFEEHARPPRDFIVEEERPRVLAEVSPDICA